MTKLSLANWLFKLRSNLLSKGRSRTARRSERALSALIVWARCGGLSDISLSVDRSRNHLVFAASLELISNIVNKMGTNLTGLSYKEPIMLNYAFWYCVLLALIYLGKVTAGM
jgi:hypothetical protein